MLSQSPDRVIAALSSLEGNAEFQVVLGWLESNFEELKDASCYAKDEVLMRWQQGACQALGELVTKAKTARQAHYSRPK